MYQDNFVTLVMLDVIIVMVVEYIIVIHVLLDIILLMIIQNAIIDLVHQAIINSTVVIIIIVAQGDALLIIIMRLVKLRLTLMELIIGGLEEQLLIVKWGILCIIGKIMVGAFVIFVIRIVINAMGLLKINVLLANDLIICGISNLVIAKKLAQWEAMELVIGLESI